MANTNVKPNVTRFPQDGLSDRRARAASLNRSYKFEELLDELEMREYCARTR